MVIVPATESMGPVFSSWTGPTKLRSTVDGDGPKYERSTVAPTEGGAGNTSHPGPAPLGPGPGPCAALKLPDGAEMYGLKAGALISAVCSFRGTRWCLGSSAWAPMPSVIAAANAAVRRWAQYDGFTTFRLLVATFSFFSRSSDIRVILLVSCELRWSGQMAFD